MRVLQKITIDKPIADVWRVLAEDFDKASDWMASIPNSYALRKGQPPEGAPMTGRICELTKKPGGLELDESITRFDSANHVLGIKVVPTNAPGAFPVYWSNVEVTLTPLTSARTEVRWVARPHLKPHGYLLYPVLKFGLNKGFSNVLEELKFFVETQKPHPRKLKKAG